MPRPAESSIPLALIYWQENLVGVRGLTSPRAIGWPSRNARRRFTTLSSTSALEHEQRLASNMRACRSSQPLCVSNYFRSLYSQKSHLQNRLSEIPRGSVESSYDGQSRPKIATRDLAAEFRRCAHLEEVTVQLNSRRRFYSHTHTHTHTVIYTRAVQCRKASPNSSRVCLQWCSADQKSRGEKTRFSRNRLILSTTSYFESFSHILHASRPITDPFVCKTLGAYIIMKPFDI